jgi:hypothetical protein
MYDIEVYEFILYIIIYFILKEVKTVLKVFVKEYLLTWLKDTSFILTKFDEGDGFYYGNFFFIK